MFFQKIYQYLKLNIYMIGDEVVNEYSDGRQLK